MDAAQPPIPLCPLTGLPAVRRLQWLYPRTLEKLWRYSFRTDIARFTAGVARFGLWESPCGLMFFDPMIAGDRRFYEDFYGGHDMHARLAGRGVSRPEFDDVAEFVRLGMKFLDVGSGDGGLEPHLPGVEYWGLDTYAGGDRANILPETIERHAERQPGSYDAVGSFQVAEHVADPRGFAEAMVKALKPGGLFLLSVPLWPSPMTAVPNFVINAPPHHLSWWNEKSLRVLCDLLGLAVREIRPVPFAGGISVIYWMSRFAPRRRERRFFSSAWTWHLSLVACWLGGAALDRLFRVPKDAPPAELLLIAEKPAA